MARDHDNTPQTDSVVGDDAAVAAAGMTSVAGVAPSAQPEQVGSGKTLVSTRVGYEFHGSTIDVPVTSVGVLVSKAQAEEIQAEAEQHGEIVYINNDQEG